MRDEPRRGQGEDPREAPLKDGAAVAPCHREDASGAEVLVVDRESRDEHREGREHIVSSTCASSAKCGRPSFGRTRERHEVKPVP